MSIKSQSNTGIFLEGFKNDLRHLNRIQILSGHFCVFTFYICAVPDCLPSASPWHFPLRPRLWSSGVSQCNHGAQSNRKLTAWGSLSSPSGTEALSNLPLTKDWICARDLTTGPVLTVSSWTRFSHADSKLLIRLHSAIHDMQGEDSVEKVKKRRRRACMSDSHLCPKILQIHLPAVVGGWEERLVHVLFDGSGTSTIRMEFSEGALEHLRKGINNSEKKTRREKQEAEDQAQD